MTRSLTRRLSLALLLAPTSVLLWPVMESRATAQAVTKEQPKAEGAEAAKVETPKPPQPKPVTIVEPVARRIYQRNSENRADIPIVLGEGAPADAIVSASLQQVQGLSFGTGIFRDGKLLNVPTGGPYMVQVTIKEPAAAPANAFVQRVVSLGPVFVGDLWVLAGQSNMQGVGNLIDVTPPSERVMALGMDGKWVRAEEPLHWLVDSPDPVHSGNSADRAARSEAEHRNRTKGAGLGLPFGVVMAASTNVPVGLVICAHGGTSMAQWDPTKKGEGGNSLYGSMLRQVKLAGGKARGVLWYQGEAEANAEHSKVYPQVFADFIGAVRSDLGDPDLPFYLVQIGRFVHEGDPKFWNAVQDAQRLIPDRVSNTAAVASVDLELDDAIHVGTPGLKRLGVRLARIALRELFGQVGATTPTLDRVSKRGDNALVVKFKGVNRAPDLSGFRQQLPGFNMAIPLTSAASSVPGQMLEGLQPERHIAGFSVRKADGTKIPLIFDAAVGQSKDTVVLKLTGPVPAGANLWYGYGYDPYCNLTDALDMAVPVFGPISLDDIK